MVVNEESYMFLEIHPNNISSSDGLEKRNVGVADRLGKEAVGSSPDSCSGRPNSYFCELLKCCVLIFSILVFHQQGQ